MSDEQKEPSEFVGAWRGRVDKTLEILEKSAEKTNITLEHLQSQVTRLVVIAGLASFFASIVTSIIVGFILKKMLQ